MKKSYIFFAAALSFMSLVSCSDDLGIETEVNKSPEVVATGKLQVTGTINKDPETRVSFVDGGTSITPSWAVGDQVFGFYGDNTLTYEVASVADGVASFSLVDGTEPADGTTVHMIYAPSKSVSDLSSQQLAIDLSQQDGTLAGIKDHAIMCATATVSGTSLSLQFENQVAIVGVKQFTGLKASTTYTSVTFTTAGTSGTIQVVDDVLTFVPDAIYGTITATGSFSSDGSGNSVYPIYFAVPSTSAVAHTFALHSSSDHRAGTLSPKAVTAGKYLYMNSKAMTKTLIFDDFEDTPENTFPASLGIYHNGTGSGNQKVITSEKKNGSKALHLQGSSGWSANITQNGTFDFDGVETYIMECYMYQVNETGTANGGMGFAQLYGSGGYHTATVGWQNNCWEFTSGSGRSQYSTTNETGKWYHLKIVCDFNTNLYDIYVDGVLIANGVTMNNVTPTYMLLAAGNGGTNNVYFDDVMVYTKPYIPDNISNYTEIAYIQSSGTQYINTRIAPTADTKVVLKNFCCLNANDWDMFFGMSNEIGEAHTWMLRYGNDGTIQSCIGDIRTSPYRNYAQAYTLGTTLSEVSVDYTNGLVINGAKATYSGYQNTPTYSTQSIYLFGGNNLSGAFWRGPSMRISACEIWEGSTKVRDLVAVKRKSDNVLGLYDRVENRFYINKGSGAFIPPFDPSTISGSAPVLESAGCLNNECGWVQLWENGPKWAVFNVGVTDGKPESYGNFYEYGAAGDLWGSNWRLPTKQEFDNLLAECDKVSETINGVKGMLVSGKGIYSSNKVFFPAGGYQDPYATPSVQRSGEFGRFWSSTDGSSYACGYCMGFNEDPSEPFVGNGGYYFGHSVRAVLAE